MEERYCQSCGMPMGQTNELYGKNSDGSINEDYCKYCYDNGKFLGESKTVEDMIEECVPHMEGMEPEAARALLQEMLPKLKRWKAK